MNPSDTLPMVLPENLACLGNGKRRTRQVILLVAGLSAFLGAGCIGSEGSSRPEATHVPLVVPKHEAEPMVDCARGVAEGAVSPEVAYQRYAEAINNGSWCAAIQSFEPDSRARAALANFKALALLAGMDGPKQTAYLRDFVALCERHRLDCGTEANARALARDIAIRAPESQALAAAAGRAEQDAMRLYVDVITSLATVDPEAVARLEVPLRTLEVGEERATGTVQQSNGRVSPVVFAKTSSGWMLTVE